MTLKQFIDENRDEIDEAIRQFSGGDIDDGERELWIMNDESLYLWAKRENVKEIL